MSKRVLSEDRVAVLTLALAMGAHQVAETARDAMFLRELGPTRLPLVYLLLAAIGAAIALLPLRDSTRRPWLSKLLFLTALGTGAFYWISTRGWRWTYEGLYVWTGLSTTVVVTFFWLFMSSRHAVNRAKVVFSQVALGGIVGALLGATIARVITAVADTRVLLLGSAALALLAGGAAFGLERIAIEESEELRSPKRARGRAAPSLSDRFRHAMRSPYARVVGGILLLASVTFTLLDYTFKSVVAEHVSKGELADVFATFYIVLNLASLFAQAVLARRLMSSVGLTTVMLLLPLMIVLGAGGVLLGGGLAAALLLKGADGSLRYSVHRTVTELLFVPMREATRSVVKPLFDIAGKPGGQAIASLLILAFLRVSERNSVYAVMTLVLAALWIGAGVHLRRLYLDVFRSTLHEDSVDTRVELPELEVDSLATLVAQLNDEQDAAVCGAMEILQAHRQTALIPDLVLYHPSPEVLIHALRIFRQEGRSRVRSLARRLLSHREGGVRAEALLLSAATDPEFECPPELLRDPEPLVRGAASALMLGQETNDLSHQDDMFQIGFASAADHLPERARRSLAPALIARLSPEAQKRIAESLETEPQLREVPLLLHLLSIRQAREPARRALLELGRPALEMLVAALKSESTPLPIRYHLPRTISRFAPKDAAPILLERIAGEKDDLIVHKVLRGLGRIKANHPELQLDEERLLQAAERMTARAAMLRRIRRSLQLHSRDVALIELIEEAENRGIEHLFRVLHLMHPTEQMERIFRNTTSDDPERRSGAGELLSHLVDRRLRDEVLALTSEESPAVDESLPDETEALQLLEREDSGVLGYLAAQSLVERSPVEERAEA